MSRTSAKFNRRSFIAGSLANTQMWIDAAARHFDGEIVVGRDLLEI